MPKRKKRKYTRKQPDIGLPPETPGEANDNRGASMSDIIDSPLRETTADRKSQIEADIHAEHMAHASMDMSILKHAFRHFSQESSVPAVASVLAEQLEWLIRESQDHKEAAAKLFVGRQVDGGTER